MKELLMALKKNGYKPFDSEREATIFLLECYEKIANYVKAVYMQNWDNIVSRETLDPTDMRDRIEEVDRRRTIVHDNALNAINQLNRLGNLNGVGSIINIDTTNRRIAAKEIGEFVNQTFNDNL